MGEDVTRVLREIDDIAKETLRKKERFYELLVKIHQSDVLRETTKPEKRGGLGPVEIKLVRTKEWRGTYEGGYKLYYTEKGLTRGTIYREPYSSSDKISFIPYGVLDSRILGGGIQFLIGGGQWPYVEGMGGLGGRDILETFPDLTIPKLITGLSGGLEEKISRFGGKLGKIENIKIIIEESK